MNKNPLILIVDDAKHNLQVLGNFLKKENYNIAVATHGDKALEIVKQNPPDLILLDILMPDMNGFEVCEKIKMDPNTRDVPVIFLSALSSVEDIVKGFELGASDYVTKPFNRTELLVRVKTHLEIKKNREALKASNAAKDRFFSIIAHDLKNPFVSILSYIRLVRNNLEKNENNELLSLTNELSDNVERTGKLLENLLEWSRQQIDSSDQPMEYFDLIHIFRKIQKYLHVDLEKKNITLQLPSEKEILVFGNENMSETIMRNLVSNAIKFSFEGQEVQITISEHDDFNEVAVKDQGVGIKSEHIHKLFRIDTKVTTEGTQEERGSGIGLILCKELAQKQGGDIVVQSELGKGSTFKFKIPRHSDHSIQKA